MISIPFLGSKRNYIKQVEEVIKSNGYTKIFEPFGGSCVLSVNAFNDGLIEKAYINDYDHLFDIYPEYLDIKDRLVSELYEKGIFKDVKKKKLPVDHQEILQNLVSQIDKKYWSLLANNFVFSGRAAGEINLKDFVYFFNEIGTEKQRYYLSIINQLERSSLDYKDFYKKYQNEFDSRSLIIIDPPYLNSVQKHYKNSEFFGLADTLELLEATKETGTDFLFFNMVERDTRKLLEVFGFNIVDFHIKRKALNYGSSREDILAYVSQNRYISSRCEIA